MRTKKPIFLKELLDPEISVFKKQAFLFFLDMELEKAMRYHTYISLLLVELGYSKPQAKDIGEKVQRLASILSSELRSTDIVGRLDKDKLSVILPNTDRISGNLVKERLGATLADYRFPSFFALACFPSDGTDFIHLLKVAMSQLQGTLG